MSTVPGLRSLIYLAASQPITASTALVTATGMSFNLGAGKSAKVRGWAPFSLAGTASGAKFQVTPSQVPTTYLLSWKLFSGASTGSLAAFADQTASAAFSNALASAANHLLEFECYVVANLACSVSLQFAQLVSDAAAITMLAGSSMELTLI